MWWYCLLFWHFLATLSVKVCLCNLWRGCKQNNQFHEVLLWGDPYYSVYTATGWNAAINFEFVRECAAALFLSLNHIDYIYTVKNVVLVKNICGRRIKFIQVSALTACHHCIQTVKIGGLGACSGQYGTGMHFLSWIPLSEPQLQRLRCQQKFCCW